jgi:hypothetical protein
MSHAILARNIEPTTRTARSALFKRDHPRAIDQFINFFGGAAGESTVGGDPCGEALLDAIEPEERLSREVGP